MRDRHHGRDRGPANTAWIAAFPQLDVATSGSGPPYLEPYSIEYLEPYSINT